MRFLLLKCKNWFFPLVIFVCQVTFSRPTFSKWDRARHRWLRPSAPRWGHHPQVRSQDYICLPVLLRKKAVLRAIKYVLWSLLSFLSHFQKNLSPPLPEFTKWGLWCSIATVFTNTFHYCAGKRMKWGKAFPTSNFQKKKKKKWLSWLCQAADLNKERLRSYVERKIPSCKIWVWCYRRSWAPKEERDESEMLLPHWGYARKKAPKGEIRYVCVFWAHIGKVEIKLMRQKSSKVL